MHMQDAPITPAEAADLAADLVGLAELEDADLVAETKGRLDAWRASLPAMRHDVATADNC
jgi:hypothetical protein